MRHEMESEAILVQFIPLGSFVAIVEEMGARKAMNTPLLIMEVEVKDLGGRSVLFLGGNRGGGN